jgi:single-strand DNA-binding protein
MNKILLIGRLGADPELTYSDKGNAKARLSLATSEHFTDRDGNKKESTQWHRVIVWGKQAEACGRYLAKGRQVAVEGRVEYRSYEKDGQTRYVTEVNAVHVEFLGSGRDGGGERGGSGPQGGEQRGGGGGGERGVGRDAGEDEGGGGGNSGGVSPPEDDDIPF